MLETSVELVSSGNSFGRPEVGQFFAETGLHWLKSPSRRKFDDFSTNQNHANFSVDQSKRPGYFDQSRVGS